MLDCHEEWCGPTTAAMGPSYLAIFADYDKPEERIFLASVQYTESITKKLQGMVHDVKFEKQGCRPLFLIFRNGACVGSIDGLNVPSIASTLKLWVPPLVVPEEEA